MKQIILSLAILALTSAANISKAQAFSDVAYNYLPSASENLFDDETISETKVTAVNIKAVRDFSRAHKNVTDAKWFKTDKGFAAAYSAEGKTTKIVYDNKGRWQYNIISYTEALLDASIRHQVKSSYYDYTIIGVHQFEFENREHDEFANKTVYVIKMLSQQSKAMTITSCDGKIEDITSKK